MVVYTEVLIAAYAIFISGYCYMMLNEFRKEKQNA